ncbi:hypothetical protein ACET3Z_033196 [Daucus carota]
MEDNWEKGDHMAFIMEFAENLVLKLMEDPRERDRKFREHLYTLKDKSSGILRLARSLVVAIPMMIFFKIIVTPPPDSVLCDMMRSER